MLPIDIAARKAARLAAGEEFFYADAIASAGYKWLCGAFGAALMYVSPRLHDINPGLVGFRSHHDMWATDATRLQYPSGAKRFEFATMHFGSALGLAKACELLLEIGLHKIWAHNLGLVDYLVARLRRSVVLAGGSGGGAVPKEGGGTKAELSPIMPCVPPAPVLPRRYEVVSPVGAESRNRSAICSLKFFQIKISYSSSEKKF